MGIMGIPNLSEWMGWDPFDLFFFIFIGIPVKITGLLLNQDNEIWLKLFENEKPLPLLIDFIFLVLMSPIILIGRSIEKIRSFFRAKKKVSKSQNQ